MSATGLSDVERAAIRELGSVAAAARALGIPRGTLRHRHERDVMDRAEVGLSNPGSARPAGVSAPKLTRAALDAALKPPNNCKVKQFRDSLDGGSQRVLDDALAYDRQDLSASRLRSVLVEAGFPDADVPGVDAINAHRNGARPCRCKG